MSNATKPVPEKYTHATVYVINNLVPLFLAFGTYVSFIIPRNSGSLNFQASEIDFLFPAPFTRRELLIYKLLGVFTGTLVYCLGMSVLIGAGFVFLKGSLVLNILRGFIALTLIVLMFRLFFILAGLLRRSVELRLFTPARKVVAVLGGILLLVGFFSIRNQFSVEALGDVEKLKIIAKGFVDSEACQWFIAPFRIFTNLILAKNFFASVFWFSLCCCVIVFIVFLIMKTDENFLETELQINQMKMEQAKRARSMETAMVPSGKIRSLPMLPFLGGIGPITWRQLQTFYRTRKLIIAGMVFFLLYLGFMLMLEPKRDVANYRFGVVVAMLFLLMLTATLALPMGFQTDVNKMDLFKSLPCSSFQVTAGQLLGPLALLTITQWLVVFVCMFTALELWERWLVVIAFVPVTSLVLLCTINSLSLLYPKRPDDGVVRELESIGHILVFVFLMLAIGLVLTGALVSAGMMTYFLTGSTVFVLLACWFVMFSASVFGVWTTAKVFERFDVSKHQM